jgi:multidrug efflux pump subunit AcrA (membrane-fusion protein)
MRKRWGVILLAVVALAGCSRSPAPTPTPIATAPSPASAPRSRGDSVVASGEVVPTQEAQLSFALTGQVQRVAVGVGDEVEPGDLLVTLEAEALKAKVAQAEAALASAEAQLAQAKAGARPEEIAAAQEVAVAATASLTATQAAWDQALATLQGARASEESAQAGLKIAQAEVTTAQEGLSTAEAKLALLKAGASVQQRAIAQLLVDQARNSLWAAQAERDSVGGAVERGEMRDADLDAAEAAVGNAHVALDIAKLTCEEVEAGPRPEEIAVAQSDVATTRAKLSGAEARAEAAETELSGARAQVALAEAQVAGAEAQVVAAQARLAQAEAQLELLKAGPKAEDVALAQAQMTEAEAALAAAESALSGAELTASFGGTVTDLGISSGETVLPGQAVLMLADLHHLQVETTDLSERDVDRVAVGQQATVYVEALGVDIGGRVVRIAPQATTVGGDVVYTVVIELDEQPSALRWGMSVEVGITTG